MHRASIHRFPYSQKIRSWQKPQVLAVGRGDLAGARYHITRWRILGKVCLFSVILSSHPTSNHFAYISTMYPIGQVKAHFIVLKKQKKKKASMLVGRIRRNMVETYCPGSEPFMLFRLRCCDMSTGYVRRSSSFFNADRQSSTQWRGFLVRCEDLRDLKKYGC